MAHRADARVVGVERRLGDPQRPLELHLGADEVPDGLAGTVGVTAGASAPDELVEEVVARLAPVGGVEEVRITEESEYFPPPRELRELLTAIDVAATATVGGSVAGRPTLPDRQLRAADVLAALAR